MNPPASASLAPPTLSKLSEINNQLMQCDNFIALCGEFERELLWGGSHMLHRFETVISAVFFDGKQPERCADKLRQQLSDPATTLHLWNRFVANDVAVDLLALQHTMMVFFERARQLLLNDNAPIDASIKSTFERWLRKALVLSAPVVCLERHSFVEQLRDDRGDSKRTFDWMIQLVDLDDRELYRALLIDSGSENVAVESRSSVGQSVGRSPTAE
jgi:hypothetical protein